MMAESFVDERRTYQRFEECIPIKICHGDADIVTETNNVSCSGVYCRINRYIEPMTKMKIHFLLPTRKNEGRVSKKVSCNGVVVRVESCAETSQYNIALFFSEISQRSVENILDFVNSRSEN